jgi:hypothetical protein
VIWSSPFAGLLALFLTLGGHWRGCALTSLAYFRCSRRPLENSIGPKPTFRHRERRP